MKQNASHITVRKAVTKDVPAVLELWKEFMDFHKVRDPYYTRSVDGHENFAKFVNENIEKEDALVTVAESGGEIVGYCLAMVTKRPPVFDIKECGAIFDLAVTEAHRRSGAGSLMVENVKKWFEERGINRIEAAAATANEVSTAFWSKMGFRTFLEKQYLEL